MGSRTPYNPTCVQCMCLWNHSKVNLGGGIKVGNMLPPGSIPVLYPLFHTGYIALLLNIKTGHVYYKYKVDFYYNFNTVKNI